MHFVILLTPFQVISAALSLQGARFTNEPFVLAKGNGNRNTGPFSLVWDIGANRLTWNGSREMFLEHGRFHVMRFSCNLQGLNFEKYETSLPQLKFDDTLDTHLRSLRGIDNVVEFIVSLSIDHLPQINVVDLMKRFELRNTGNFVFRGNPEGLRKLSDPLEIRLVHLLRKIQLSKDSSLTRSEGGTN